MACKTQSRKYLMVFELKTDGLNGWGSVPGGAGIFFSLQPCPDQLLDPPYLLSYRVPGTFSPL